jgi:hypothetical protein
MVSPWISKSLFAVFIVLLFIGVYLIVVVAVEMMKTSATRFEFRMVNNRLNFHSDKTLNSYSGGAWFESQRGYQLS